ncbi:MAG: hybrid sensor histidine kinase/response regulator [Candidatus Eisenbacteria bacterium]
MQIPKSEQPVDATRSAITGQKISILLVEDNQGDARLIKEMLSETGAVRFDVEVRGRLESSLECLASQDIDVVLLDLSLPDSQGLGTFSKIHEAASQIPVVVLTGLADERVAAGALREGAQDYLIKGHIDGDLLSRSIRYAIERQEMLKQLEETRRQELRTKDQFLSHVSHELRSPVAVIHQFVTILADGLAGHMSAEQRDHLQTILKNVNQLVSMIDGLLAVTRIRESRLTVEPCRTAVAEIMAEVTNAFMACAGGKGIALSAHFPNDLPQAYADPDRVREVLTNLIDNAIKFTPEGGSITVTGAVSSEDTSSLCLAVSDTGYGIDPKETEKVFECLYQGKATVDLSRKGLGLGLYICKEIVSCHGGRIWAESEIGRGTTFHFTLPAFSLVGLIRPILTAENLRNGSIALISVDLSVGGEPLPARVPPKVVQQVRQLLERCSLMGRDVVLPQMGRGERSETVYLVACADAAGLEVLVNRIRAQLKLLEELRKARINEIASFDVLDIGSIDSAPQPEDIAHGIAALIEKRERSGSVPGKGALTPFYS